MLLFSECVVVRSGEMAYHRRVWHPENKPISIVPIYGLDIEDLLVLNITLSDLSGMNAADPWDLCMRVCLWDASEILPPLSLSHCSKFDCVWDASYISERLNRFKTFYSWISEVWDKKSQLLVRKTLGPDTNNTRRPGHGEFKISRICLASKTDFNWVV